jgi:hypothetical protein
MKGATRRSSRNDTLDARREAFPRRHFEGPVFIRSRPVGPFLLGPASQRVSVKRQGWGAGFELSVVGVAVFAGASAF